VDHAERLADYLAGELDADERAALEAELARDGALRARLEALRRADTALSRLSSPTPPEGFDARLDARLDQELASLLESSTSEPVVDELAERRAQRQVPRWVVAVSGAAAGLIVLAGVGVVITNGLGSSPDESPFDMGPTSLDAADDDVPAEERAEAMELPMAGPQIVDRDRDLDDAAIGSMLAEGEPLALADFGLEPATALELRGSYLDALGVGEVGVAEADDPDEAADPADDAAAADDAGERLMLRTDGEVSDQDLADVSRCLAVLLEDSPTALPVYAELGTRDGESVIAIGFVSEDPTTGLFTRREVWIMSREGCEVRGFVQR
jgi:hypothetical protein